MCQSYRKVCECGQNTTEIFFGKMIFDEQVVAKVYCPHCSQSVATDCDNRVWDNDWVLELNMEVVQAHIPVMDIAPEDITADRIFDEGYVTWVGITPDDHQTREQERNQIQKLAKTDLLAYIQAMKEWGLNREKRFVNEGWRKMRARAIH
ncbi:MAG: hypothetical protein H8D96_02310 [Desulfobacterales bacterium]|uniref:Uncharacterized protein n=1 Tax=Candidatus Desulfatibia vada TaxID=2841696 RepID=A0A8J6TKU4_9BACT|nr:hypothetical protein [Candidatus Desulfatibia vada]MBL6971790.1 hypothetical protein [Desulfobacterales bacterium]